MKYVGGAAEKDTRKLEQALHWRCTGQESGPCHGFCSFCCESHTNTPKHCETNCILFACLIVFYFVLLYFFVFVIDFTFISKKQKPSSLLLETELQAIFIYLCVCLFFPVFFLEITSLSDVFKGSDNT